MKRKNTKEKEREISKNNMKLYPVYTMFAYDLLFFYGTKVMYFNEIKGFSNSQIMLSSTFYAIFTIFMQFPTSLIVSKLGRRNTMILGNIINIFSIIMFLALRTFNGLIIGQLISAIAFGFKSISETNLLSISIPESSNSAEIFTEIDKRGYSRFCLFSAASTILGGFFYQINGYLPMFLCLICAVIATYLSFNFDELENKKQEKISLKSYVKELRQGYKFTINSKRLRALLLSTGVIWGIISLIDTYQLALLQEVGASSIMIGFIFAIYEISKAVFSRTATFFNDRFKNKSLTNILALFSFSLIISGVIALFKINLWIKLLLIVFFIIIMGSMNGTSQILSRKYLNSFTNEKILTCLYSAKAISDNFSKIVVTGFGSFVLSFANINIATIIVGLSLIFATFFISVYMNGKVGLDPDEYTQKDIYIRK